MSDLRMGEPAFSAEAMALLDWYDLNRRTHLPWRRDPSPYHVWISEIMLQQTQVETVIPYYERFMQSFPSIKALAEADMELLLKHWEGLGYYSRARNLNRAAQQIMSDWGGELPGDKAQLLTLPGIGPYTAGAISSIAFGRKVIAADGNAYRIAARLTREAGFTDDGSTKKRLEAFLESIVPELRAGDFNQALMDLGASICVPKGEPKCERCPLMPSCRAYAAGDMTDYPRRKPKRKKRIEHYTVLIISNGEHVLLAQRPEGGVLAKLWGLPMLESHLTPEKLHETLVEWIGDMPIRAIVPLRPAKHVFTHIEWRMIGYRVELTSTETVHERILRYGKACEMRWATWEEVADRYAIPTAFAAFLGEA